MKFVTGSTTLWRWEASEPLAPESTPTLVIRRGADVVAGIPALAPTVEPVGITALADDRRKLTVSAALDEGEAAMAAGPEWGSAWVVAPGGGAFPVRISGITPGEETATVVLADPLPRTVVVAGATLQWASHYTTFSNADVTSTASRSLTWTVTYEPVHAGGAADEETQKTSTGRLIVVARLFDTGLTPETLASIFPASAGTVHSRDNSRGGIIAAAKTELELSLLPEARARNLHIDDLDGSMLTLCHAHIAMAAIVEANQPDRAQTLRERAATLRDLALRAIWADLDADGMIDPGEDGAALSGPPRLSSSVARRTTRVTPTFTRGMSH